MMFLAIIGLFSSHLVIESEDVTAMTNLFVVFVSVELTAFEIIHLLASLFGILLVEITRGGADFEVESAHWIDTDFALFLHKLSVDKMGGFVGVIFGEFGGLVVDSGKLGFASFAGTTFIVGLLLMVKVRGVTVNIFDWIFFSKTSEVLAISCGVRFWSIGETFSVVWKHEL